MSNSLRPHGLQHARPPCPSLTPGLYSNSCSLSQWCHPTNSSSVVPFSSCLQSFPTSGSFQVSQLFAWGSQNIGVSASTSVLPMNTQDWSPLGWTGWNSLQSKELSRVFSKTIVQKHQFFGAHLSLWSNSQICTWLLENTHTHTRIHRHTHYIYTRINTYVCCCCLVAQLCLILCDPMDCSSPGLPVHHQLPEFT